MSVVFESSEGRVLATDIGAGRRRLAIELASGDSGSMFCDTQYSDELIRCILTVRGLAMLRDELARDEDRNYVERDLRYAMFGYLSEEQFAGKRLLDFGCGAGASTMVLVRILPNTEIVAVDLFENQVAVAEARADFTGPTTSASSSAPGRRNCHPTWGCSTS